MPTSILIVGASRGIGRATAVALARPDRRLTLFARDGAALAALAAELRAAGAAATAVPGDVTSEADVARAVAAAAADGQIDVLVNSAGSALVRPLAAIGLVEWEAALRLNLTGAFLTCRACAPLMPSGGLIINIASVAARQAFPGWSAYSAAKAGLLAFSNAIREELRPAGVRVSVVLPAATDTDIWAAVPGDWNRTNMLSAADVGAAIAALTDQPRHMTTEELVVGHVAGRL